MQYANHTTDSAKKIILFHIQGHRHKSLYLADELIARGCYKTLFKSDLETTNPISSKYSL